jgi:NAD(P)-dependent dehydrogenase (short-subunit alcohol dehydrogenase family)
MDAGSLPGVIARVIVTGANSGLGLECTRALLDRGGTEVILAVRDEQRGEAARRELGRSGCCRVEHLDLASLGSVEEFTRRVGDGLAGAPVTLVLNAGVQVTAGSSWTEDGVELTFGVNHLSHFCLARGLLDSLAPGSRVVIVASDTHDPRRLTGMPAPEIASAQTLAHPPAGDSATRRRGRVRYTTSKLCNVLFAYELQRRIEASRPGEDLATIAFNPGLMPGSGLARDYGRASSVAWRHLLPRLPIARTTKESGEHLAALAVDPAFAEAGGLYFDREKPIRSSLSSYDPTLARALWEESEELCRELGHPVPAL